MILEIRHVSKHYTGKTALEDLSLEIPKSCVYGLLGPNGAGKTSLIRIINQITQADEGEVYFDGEKLNASHIGKIGYLPEERGLYKKVKVVDQLTYFAKLRGMNHKEALEKAHWWLKKMGLFDIRNKRIEEFSKGMQQKVQFIVSVIHEPQLLILDEPFSGFDPINAELLTGIILELKQKGTTILFSTHRMESVEKLCDYMALIHQSRKILDGKVSEIKQRYRSDKFDIVTEKSINFNHPSIELLGQSVTDAGYPSYSIRVNSLKNNELIAYVAGQSEIISFNLNLPSIHDIFIQSVS